MNKKQILQASPEDIIKEFNLAYAERDGHVGFLVRGKQIGKLQREALLERKPDIMAVLIAEKSKMERIKSEREAAEQARVAAADALINNDTLLSLSEHSSYGFGVLGKDLYGSTKLKALKNRLQEIRSYRIETEEVLKPYYSSVDWGDYSTTTFWKLTYGQLVEVIEKLEVKVVEKKQQIEEKKQAKESAIAAKFEESKQTGKPVVLHQWSEDCNDPNEECNVDNLTEYAMPDGSTKIVRHHTW